MKADYLSWPHDCLIAVKYKDNITCFYDGVALGISSISPTVCNMIINPIEGSQGVVMYLEYGQTVEYTLLKS